MENQKILKITKRSLGRPLTIVLCALCLLGLASEDIGATVIAASDSRNKKQADYVCDGTADNVEIQAVIDALPLSGGRVLLLDGTYITRAAIKLRDNVTLSGNGPSTIIRAVNEIKSNLIQDANSGQNQVVVIDGSGYKIGMDVIIKDDNTSAGWHTTMRTIAAIKRNTITLDDNLARNYTVGANGFIANAFPIILAGDRYDDEDYLTGTTRTGIVIENLKIDGNKDNVGSYTWQQAGISFFRVTHSVIRNNWIVNSSYEGISNQEFGPRYNGIEGYNKIINNTITGSTGQGIHLGGNAIYCLVSGNQIHNNGVDGIQFCSWVEYSIISNNIICGNSGAGINAIGFEGKYDIIESNVIMKNGTGGIQAFNAEHITITNNLVMNNSQRNGGNNSGIYLNNVKHFVVEGNTCCDSQSSKTQKYGIEEVGTSDYNTITSNELTDNLKGSLLIVGTHNRVRDNMAD